MRYFGYFGTENASLFFVSILALPFFAPTILHSETCLNDMRLKFQVWNTFLSYYCAILMIDVDNITCVACVLSYLVLFLNFLISNNGLGTKIWIPHTWCLREYYLLPILSPARGGRGVCIARN